MCKLNIYIKYLILFYSPSQDYPVTITKAWSNSVLSKTEESSYVRHFYAKYAVSKTANSHWSSTGEHKMKDEIIWQAKFERLSRVHSVLITWAMAPGEYKIIYSTEDVEDPLEDPENEDQFFTIVPWTNSKNASQEKHWGWWERFNPYIKNAYLSYPEKIIFKSPISAFRIRIVMRIPINKYFGIYKVNFFTKDWLVILKANKGMSCWAVSPAGVIKENLEGLEKSKEDISNPFDSVKMIGKEVILNDCTDLIMLSDNRELFIITPDSVIKHLNSELCVVLDINKNLLILDDCSKTIIQNLNSNIFKFIYNKTGYIQSGFNNKCLIPKKQKPEDISNLLKGKYKINVSSQKDPWHGSQTLLLKDSNGFSNSGYWASMPGESSAFVLMTFNAPGVLLASFYIKWKFVCKTFNVMIKTKEQGWKPILREKDNKKYETVVKFGRLFTILDIRIDMLKSDYLYNNKSVIYGISEIGLISNSEFIVTGDCNLNDNKNLKAIQPIAESEGFQVEEQTYFKTNQLLNYTTQFSSMPRVNLNLLKLLQNLNLKKEYLVSAKTKNTTYYYRQVQYIKQIKKIGQDLIQFKHSLIKLKNKKMTSILENIKNSNNQKVNNMIEGNFYNSRNINKESLIGIASNPKYPAKDCYQIQEIAPGKKTGMYWIHPICSPKPIRVFCDFSLGSNSNKNSLGATFYIFNNNQLPNTVLDPKKFKIKDYKDIRYQCARLGLEPLVIKDEIYLTNVKMLLEANGWNLEIPELTVPFAFDYTCETRYCMKKFNSFNTRMSPILNDFLNDVDLNQSFSANSNEPEKQTLNFDTIGLGGDFTSKYKYFSLGDHKNKITALLCSTNESNQSRFDNVKRLSSKNTLDTISEFDTLVPGSKVRIECELLCKGRIKNTVYGIKNLYKGYSSICRAAIHSGKLNRFNQAILLIENPTNLIQTDTIISNGVTSNISLIAKSRKDFRFENVVDHCPLDFFQNYNESSVQTIGKITAGSGPEQVLSSFIELENRSESEDTPQSRILMEALKSIVIKAKENIKKKHAKQQELERLERKKEEELKNNTSKDSIVLFNFV